MEARNIPFFCIIVMVERMTEYYIEEPLDEFDRVVLNFILTSQNIRNRLGYEVDAVEERLIRETILEMSANGELD